MEGNFIEKQLFEQNEALARDFTPLSEEKLEALVRATAPIARELVCYKP